ncbi:uncharacterized protein LOC133906073 [Phragmites australis]|uniref:uncharacterized protein LOC133906073 n=1 Tax=Phragmites australis TaxID=29695 RepID=UPI002D7715A3|nr:uncharacterized protein LOC133906073 [Phragmites australis]
MDPVVGTNQSMGAFWQRIESFYHEHKDFPSTRNKKSLQGRWTFVNGMVQRFCGHYAKALRNRRSGMTEADTIVAACKMFQAAEKREFTLMPCWVELRHHPKWQTESSRKKQKTGAERTPVSTQEGESSPGCNEGEVATATHTSGSSQQNRPAGRNKAKDLARGSSSSTSVTKPVLEMFDRQIAVKEKLEKERADRFAEMLRIKQQRLRLEEERVLLEKVKEERQKIREEREIMSMDISQMDEDQQAYYRSLRRSIIAAR